MSQIIWEYWVAFKFIIMQVEKGQISQRFRGIKNNKMIIQKKDNVLKEIQKTIKEMENGIHDHNMQEYIFKLQLLYNHSKKFPELQEVAVLAIGKIIMIIQLNKLKQRKIELNQNKESLDRQFRQNRIKFINYKQLQDQKLENNIIIIQPYSNGIGFKLYNSYNKNLESYIDQKQFIEIIANVNKIQFDIIGIGTQQRKNTNFFFKFFLFFNFVMLLFALSFMVIIVFIIYDNYNNALLKTSVVLVGLTMMISLLGAIINNNTKIYKKIQINFIIESIRKYLQTLNQKNQNLFWKLPNQFLWLQVQIIQ